MKNILKKVILGIFAIIFVCSTISYAEQEDKIKFKIIEKSEKYEQWENQTDEERKNTIEPLYFNVSIDDSMKKSSHREFLNLGDSVTDTKYDLRETLKEKISVRDQKSTGSCWAFSYVSSLETTLANKNDLNTKYSAMHLDYKTSQMFNRSVGDGGNALLGLAYCADEYGPVLESDLTFDSVYDEEENAQNKYYLSDIKDVDLEKDVKARVKDATIFASIYKEYSEGKITYKSDVGSQTSYTYTDQEVNVIRNSIKEQIKNDGAVSAVIYMKMKVTEGNYTDMDGYYNPTTKSYYCNNYSIAPNHAIAIVGWDDTYSKDNFTNKPLHDGAYIVLNSYGTEFGENGYCYISYDDATIEQLLVGIDDIEEVTQDKKNYDNMYQYDELGMATALTYESEIFSNLYVANVFTRKNTTNIEYLSEIGIYLDTTEGVDIYVVPADNGIPRTSDLGEPVATYSGSNALTAGYHIVKPSAPVRLTGNKFAVIVKYMKQGGASAPIECKLDTGVSNYWDTAKANLGESYMYNLLEWQDANTAKIDGASNINFCIKAFTTNSEERDIKVTGITLNKNTYTMNKGEKINLIATITPEEATNKKVIWTSSNTVAATVSNLGEVTALSKGTTTIKAATEDGGFTATCEITVNEDIAQEVKVTGITLNKNTYTMNKGDKFNLVAIITPENATNKNVTWTSSNTGVATVSNLGEITALDKGTTTITAVTEDGSFAASCELTVIERVNQEIKVTGVTLNKNTYTVNKGERFNLVATITPENATNKNVTWTTSNAEVATVSNTGIITALDKGTTTISVKTEDGGFIASCTLTVNEDVDNDDNIYKDDDKGEVNIQGKDETAKDGTTSNEGLPYTGIEISMMAVIVAVVGIIMYKRYKKLKDIK